MRMSVQMPRSMMGAIPDPHGVVTDHDGLAMYGDFRKITEPGELLGQLANLLVVISRDRKGLLAANLLTVLQRFRLAPDTEIPRKYRMSLTLTEALSRSRIVSFISSTLRNGRLQ